MKRHVAGCGIIFSTLFWLCLAALLLSKCTSKAKGEEARSNVGTTLVRVLDTGSMRGWAPKGGGWCILRAVPFDQVRVGDVVEYRHRRAGLVAHRVIEIKGGKLWTKGDTNKTPDDQWILPSDYLGVVEKSPALAGK